MSQFPDRRTHDDHRTHDMTPEDCIDAVELRRLAEGRLESEERDALLQWAEDHPANWREVALAFVEEQTLRQTVPAAEGLTPSAKRPATRRVMKTLAWATAACLCVAAAGFGGLAYGERRAVAARPAARPAPEKDPVLVWATARPVPERSEIEEALARAARPVFDEETRRTLLRAGVVAEERPSIRFVNGEDGRTFPVAERELIFRPASAAETEVSRPDPYPEGRP